MFDQLVKSKIRQRILKLLLAHEKEKFYLSQIAKIIHASRGTTQRELNRLLTAGIVGLEKFAYRNYYYIDNKSPLIEDYQKFFQKTLGIETELAKRLKNQSKLQYALIFGSYAKNELVADSDIDLMLIGNVDEDSLINELSQAEEIFQREINYHLYSVEEFLSKCKKDSFFQSALKNYIYLLNNQNDFEKILR